MYVCVCVGERKGEGRMGEGGGLNVHIYACVGNEEVVRQKLHQRDPSREKKEAGGDLNNTKPRLKTVTR